MSVKSVSCLGIVLLSNQRVGFMRMLRPSVVSMQNVFLNMLAKVAASLASVSKLAAGQPNRCSPLQLLPTSSGHCSFLWARTWIADSFASRNLAPREWPSIPLLGWNNGLCMAGQQQRCRNALCVSHALHTLGAFEPSGENRRFPQPGCAARPPSGSSWVLWVRLHVNQCT